MDRGIILLQLEICSETGQFLLACLPCCREYTGIISIGPQPCFSKISSFFPLQKQGKAATSTEDLLYQPSPKHRSFQWGVSLVLHSALAQEPPAPSALTWSQGENSPKAALGSAQQEQGGCDGRAPGSLSQPVPQGSNLGCSAKLVLKSFLWFVHSQLMNDPEFSLQTFRSRAPRSLWWAQRVTNTQNWGNLETPYHSYHSSYLEPLNHTGLSVTKVLLI